MKDAEIMQELNKYIDLIMGKDGHRVRVHNSTEAVEFYKKLIQEKIEIYYKENPKKTEEIKLSVNDLNLNEIFSIITKNFQRKVDRIVSDTEGNSQVKAKDRVVVEVGTATISGGIGTGLIGLAIKYHAMEDKADDEKSNRLIASMINMVALGRWAAKTIISQLSIPIIIGAGIAGVGAASVIGYIGREKQLARNIYINTLRDAVRREFIIVLTDAVESTIDKITDLAKSIMCPILMDVMTEPVFFNGRTFERKALQEYYDNEIKEGRVPMCPITRSKPLPDPNTLEINRDIQTKCDDYRRLVEEDKHIAILKQLDIMKLPLPALLRPAPASAAPTEPELSHRAQEEERAVNKVPAVSK